ncbi:MAG: cupin domain-containing protein [Acidobacteriota bacterium]|nr:cupin domain-containing protein [Acidobacteriota bacterium]
MKLKRISKTLAIATTVGVALLCVTVYSATTNILAVGTIQDSRLFDGPATVTVRTLTIRPGEVLAWHYHPGYAFNVVKSGTLTVEDGCGGEETLTPGQAFEEMDGRVHRAKNLGSTDVVVYNTFIMPQGKPTTVNIPSNERRCGPPEDVDECKSDGWLKFTHPQTFINQGQCIDFVRHRPRNTIPVPEDPLN